MSISDKLTFKNVNEVFSDHVTVLITEIIKKTARGTEFVRRSLFEMKRQGSIREDHYTQIMKLLDIIDNNRHVMNQGNESEAIVVDPGINFHEDFNPAWLLDYSHFLNLNGQLFDRAKTILDDELNSMKLDDFKVLYDVTIRDEIFEKIPPAFLVTHIRGCTRLHRWFDRWIAGSTNPETDRIAIQLWRDRTAFLWKVFNTGTLGPADGPVSYLFADLFMSVDDKNGLHLRLDEDDKKKVLMKFFPAFTQDQIQEIEHIFVENAQALMETVLEGETKGEGRFITRKDLIPYDSEVIVFKKSIERYNSPNKLISIANELIIAEPESAFDCDTLIYKIEIMIARITEIRSLPDTHESAEDSYNLNRTNTRLAYKLGELHDS